MPQPLRACCFFRVLIVVVEKIKEAMNGLAVSSATCKTYLY